MSPRIEPRKVAVARARPGFQDAVVEARKAARELEKRGLNGPEGCTIDLGGQWRLVRISDPIERSPMPDTPHMPNVPDLPNKPKDPKKPKPPKGAA